MAQCSGRFGSIVSGAYADHTLLPPGKYITMFQYLEYPASRGKVLITSFHFNAIKPAIDSHHFKQPIQGTIL